MSATTSTADTRSTTAVTRGAPLLAVYSWAVFAFIYLPIVVLIVYSFNRDGVGGFPPRHLTLDWYRQLFGDGAIWTSVLNSLIVAACSVALSLTLGLLAGRLVVIAHAPREEGSRIISMRKGNRREQEIYQKRLGTP